MAHSPIATVVVNWQLREETTKCLLSLEHLDHPCRIIVVDNGSDDGSVEHISLHFPQAELIALPSNVGFGAACNRGIGHALQDPACEFIFLLNNDAIVHPHALSELMKAAQAHPQAGILGPKVYYQDAPRKIWYAGARRRRGVLAAADTGRGEIDRGQFDTVREVDYVFGTAMLIRRDVLECIGLFDECFFLYLEDWDFCIRAQKAGFALLFAPQAHVWHVGSASTTHNKALRNRHYVGSTISFLKKHATLSSSLPLLLFWTWVSLRNMATDMASGDLEAVRSYWSGLVSSLAGGRT